MLMLAAVLMAITAITVALAPDDAADDERAGSAPATAPSPRQPEASGVLRGVAAGRSWAVVAASSRGDRATVTAVIAMSTATTRSKRRTSTSRG